MLLVVDDRARSPCTSIKRDPAVDPASQVGATLDGGEGSLGCSTDSGASYATASGTGFATAPKILSSPVPEPTEFALVLAGLGSIGWVTRRRAVRPAA